MDGKVVSKPGLPKEALKRLDEQMKKAVPLRAEQAIQAGEKLPDQNISFVLDKPWWLPRKFMNHIMYKCIVAISVYDKRGNRVFSTMEDNDEGRRRR